MRIEESGLVILASGLSRRFSSGDKLLAPLMSKPLAAHVAQAVQTAPFAAHLVVVPHDCPQRHALFVQAGFTVMANSDPAQGQGASLALGAREVTRRGLLGMCVLLADMPFIRMDHIEALFAMIGGAEAAIGLADGVRTPPALFAAPVLPLLTGLDGDRGAKAVLSRLDDVIEVPLPGPAVLDIDTVEDLNRAMGGAA